MTIGSYKKLYETDFAIWIEDTVQKLQSRNTKDLDWENLIEEIESLGKRDKRELQSRLITLFEHQLKRGYVSLPDCYRGWEVTINRTQQALQLILDDSPSLRSYLLAVMDDCYQKALQNVQKEYDEEFPVFCPFVRDVDAILERET
ncbi:DUF29 domain-containing protein [Spirulina sp. CS-785/01]|uniref:DUF29 domain-containing protein n=1 Tax=Spirulina sp. CS-785/01 TaxID=3021716 RepID=UPI00232B4840|nr:DUF29 domain-containing protein [Spirulina sp. CS-785/01]MDB9313618.1 DUF29 domain-containing protein [Spirulina sp. CS-785/01]